MFFVGDEVFQIADSPAPTPNRRSQPRQSAITWAEGSLAEGKPIIVALPPKGTTVSRDDVQAFSSRVGAAAWRIVEVRRPSSANSPKELYFLQCSSDKARISSAVEAAGWSCRDFSLRPGGFARRPNA